MSITFGVGGSGFAVACSRASVLSFRRIVSWFPESREEKHRRRTQSRQRDSARLRDPGIGDGQYPGDPVYSELFCHLCSNRVCPIVCRADIAGCNQSGLSVAEDIR
jgi:hypothetical protein